MKKSILSSVNIVLFGAAVAAVLVFSTGCEWESSGSEGSWDDSVSWVNFSGVYRSGSNARTIISDTPLSDGESDDSSSDVEHTYPNQPGAIQPSPFTVFSGTIDFINRGVPGWSLKPGSVTIGIAGTVLGAVGSFNDAGGSLSGTYSQVPGSQPFSGSGAIDYDTGAWSLVLDEPFIEPAQISYSYVVLQRINGASGAVPVNTPGTVSALAIAGGTVSSILVEQTGNRLTFRLSNGAQLDGNIISLTTAGGDRMGRTSGDVNAVYEVSGTSGGQQVKISGSFAGAYTAPGDNIGTGSGPSISGNLSDRQIQGVWIQPDGTADVYGITSQISVDVVASDVE